METGTPAPSPQPKAVLQVKSRERIAIRTRENGVTLAAWRLELNDPRGAMVMLEIGGRTVYRGEGTLLGSSQERLAEPTPVDQLIPLDELARQFGREHLLAE